MKKEILSTFQYVDPTSSRECVCILNLKFWLLKKFYSTSFPVVIIYTEKM